MVLKQLKGIAGLIESIGTTCYTKSIEYVPVRVDYDQFLTHSSFLFLKYFLLYFFQPPFQPVLLHERDTSNFDEFDEEWNLDKVSNSSEKEKTQFIDWYT